MRFFLCVGIAICAARLTHAAGPFEGYYRDPAIHGQTIVFTAEGDLWRVDAKGGAAMRLTSHPAYETSAAISPDGKQVAFSASYEGPTEAYVMPITGGLPRRLTWDGESTLVVGWSPDGRVACRTSRFSTLPNAQLVLVEPKSLKQFRVPLHQAADGSWSKSGSLCFTRFAKQGSSTKRYQGGTAENIWRFDADAAEAVPLTNDFNGTSRQPMWWKGRVYFASDRDGTMNLWSMAEDGSDLNQHTKHKHFDVLGPSLGQGRIVYQLGADLHVYDIASNKDRRIRITLTSDLDQRRETWIKKPVDFLTSVHPSPNGDRVVLCARGHVFVAPAGQGRLVQVTRQKGTRYRSARFLGDGSRLSLLSDETGEFEIWTAPANGVGTLDPLTKNGSVFRFPPIPSPDGKLIAFFDKDQQLWIHNVAKQHTTKIAKSDYYDFQDLAWSPDSRWLAFVREEANSISRVYVYDTVSRKTQAVTTDRADSHSPAWSPDGNWLYFLSERNLYSLVRSPWGARQPEPYFDNTTKIYELALQANSRSRFLPTDETIEANKSTDEDKGKEAKADKPKVAVQIDFNGLAERLLEVPVEPGNYDELAVTMSHLYWQSKQRTKVGKTALMSLAIGNKGEKPVSVQSEIKSFELTADRSRLLLRKSDDVYVIPADGKAPGSLSKAKVPLSGWTFPIDPLEEWRQMLVDAWRMERDYFYDRNLHGRDWKAILDRHLPLVDRVTDRAELNDLIEQMVGELEALHIYVRGGDHRDNPDDIAAASLGAVLDRSEEAKGYVISHIYQTDPDAPNERSPLSRLHPPARVGDVIRSVNGVPVLSVPHIQTLLRNTASKQVLIEIKDAKTGKLRKTVIKPVTRSREADMRYDEWEYTRRLRVEEQSDRTIGYVHLRAMGGDNIAEWAREFYPVFNRQGLIIDVRHNRGGNIDSWVLEKLLRKAWFYWAPRTGKPTWNMQYAFRGHMVVLCNERTASDGEAFAEGFRRLGLGKVIGTRTWGGEIWLSINNRLVDRGFASAAQWGVYGPERKWLIEGHGVDPDIVVDNLPHATFNGKDAQLDRAIKYLRKRIRKDPRPVPTPPPYPDKSTE